jgi:hypothetical protein
MKYYDRIKKVIAITEGNKVYFKEHGDVEFPGELIALGFKDESWHNDETGLAIKKINDKFYAGIWVFNPEEDDKEHKYYVMKVPADSEGEYDPGEAVDIGSADTIEEVKALIAKI